RHRPLVLVGPSLGGNFALRLAADAGAAEELGLDQVIAVSPVLDPARTVDAIDRLAPFRNYFRARWLRSLRRKAQLFPHLYDFSGLDRLSLVRPMTEWMVR